MRDGDRLIRGGQGRSDDDIESSAIVLVVTALAGVAIALGGIVWEILR
jgi:hypothetical protein